MLVALPCFSRVSCSIGVTAETYVYFVPLLIRSFQADGVVLYYVPESNALVYSANVNPQRPKEQPAYSLSTRPADRFALHRSESVMFVNWHLSGLLLAVITSHRAVRLRSLLTRSILRVMSQAGTCLFVLQVHCASLSWSIFVLC